MYRNGKLPSSPLYVTICLIQTTVCHNMFDSHHCMSQYAWFTPLYVTIYLIHTTVCHNMLDSHHYMSQYVWFKPLYVTICLIHTPVCHNMLDSHHCMSQYIWFKIYLMHTIWLLAVQKEDIRMIEDLDDPTTNNCFHLISNTEKAYRVRV